MNGNITQIWRGDTSFTRATERYSYVYDKANQLIRENLYYGSGNANNATITYEYDEWGNLLRKNIYAYTTVSTLGTPKDTMLYEYSDGNWGDVLSTYNGEEISYDKSGNPTNYFGNVLKWEGKQLKSFTPKTEGSGRVNPYTYAYDESGIRTKKVVGNTTYEYYYCGELLMGIKQTVTNTDGSTITIKQRFSYDTNGNVIALNYDGIYYYYIRNAQNDVVGLVDKNGNTVVSYTYDSWGKPLATTGSLASTLGADQPFRYRGYIYDSETGWYYLKSRYYNPSIGRFISADVYLSTGQGVLGHNAYAYCLNNPISMSDSTGNIPVKDILALFRQMIEGSGGGASGGPVKGPIVPTGEPISNPGTNGASSAAVTSGGGIIVGYDEEKNHPAGKNGLAKGNSSHPDTPNGGGMPNYDNYSTGRTLPNTIQEQISMKFVKAHPEDGITILDKLGDPRLPPGTVKKTKYVKWSTCSVEIHYLYHPQFGFFDFKFKE